MAEIQDIILARYNNMDYYLELDFRDGIDLLQKAIDRNTENRIWQRWLVDYQKMDTKTFIPFEDYYKQITNNNNIYTQQPEKSAVELMEWAEKTKQTAYKKEIIVPA